MEGFGRTDYDQILSGRTDGVEWKIPGAFHVHGRDLIAKFSTKRSYGLRTSSRR